MLIIILTIFSSYMIYNYSTRINGCGHVIDSKKKFIYFLISIVLPVIFLKLLMDFGNEDAMSVLLWCIYIPFTLNLSYLIFKTINYGKRDFANALKLWIKTFVCTCFYFLCFDAYRNGYICTMPQNNPIEYLTFSSVELIIIGGSFIWLYGEKLFRSLRVLAYQIYAVILVLTPFLLFFVLEISSNPNFGNISLFNALLNILIMLFFEIILLNLFKNRVYGLYILFSMALMIGIVNHFVVEFRNNPIMAIDILAIRTALSVSGQYQYQLTDGIVIALLATFLLVAFLSAFNRLGLTHKQGSRKENLARRFISVVVLLASVMWIGTTNFEQSYGINVDLWWPANTYNNSGFATAFITFLQKLRIKEPEGYSRQQVEELLKNAGESELPTVKPPPSKPSIIVIMNESFSDLSVLGPFECSQDHLKNLYELRDDPNTVEWGHDYVSTRGGGTATTEFEFLTGNSISNVPGTNPYAQFDFSQIPSMVGLVEAQGYHTIAMHPENPNNWRRSNVYDAMGFDEFLSRDDFNGYDTTVYNRISDLGDYKKLIHVYENQKGPSFIFNVTMQNHGGYDISSIDEAKRVSIDPKYSDFTDVQAYESLIHEADEALGYLMDYFRNVKEPVLICFFGDHQPALNVDFENQLAESGKQFNDSDLSVQEKYFAVPYFIWSNFPIDSNLSWTNQEGIDVTSTNYLGRQVMYYAGLELSDYGKFLLKQKEQLPVLNFVGYLDPADEWHSLSDDSQYLPLLNDYNMVQYNAMFDKKKDKKLYQVQEGGS